MKRYLPIYLIFSLLEIVAISITTSVPMLHYFTKPLLMILLLTFFLAVTRNYHIGDNSRVWMLVALMFSWLGDVFLMFKGESWFLVGLASFLITHLVYIFIFRKEAGFYDRRFAGIVGLLLLVFGVGLIWLIFPSLTTALKVPVAVYAITILIMVFIMALRYGNIAHNAFVMGLGGALMFMISDSLIAVSTFTKINITYPELWIMTLYLAGQYCIVESYVMTHGKPA